MNVVKKASRAATEMEGGGWEIVSHQISQIDRHVVISLLLKREVAAKDETG